MNQTKFSFAELLSQVKNELTSSPVSRTRGSMYDSLWEQFEKTGDVTLLSMDNNGKISSNFEFVTRINVNKTKVKDWSIQFDTLLNSLNGDLNELAEQTGEDVNSLAELKITLLERKFIAISNHVKKNINVNTRTHEGAGKHSVYNGKYDIDIDINTYITTLNKIEVEDAGVINVE